MLDPDAMGEIRFMSEHEHFSGVRRVSLVQELHVGEDVSGVRAQLCGNPARHCAVFPQPRYLRCVAMELDLFDRRLLNLVQENAGQTSEQIAEQIGLSPSAVQRRLRRLREDGVIERDVAVIDPKTVGRPTFFVVQVQVERDRPELNAHLREWFSTQPHVQQAFYVTGESADFVLIITAPDTETYDALMSRMVAEHPNVKRFTTNVALSVVKRGLTVPVPLEAEE
jgi:DNA-binding Lrp family transcriptional regulator